jgi:hypothetical protein
MTVQEARSSSGEVKEHWQGAWSSPTAAVVFCWKNDSRRCDEKVRTVIENGEQRLDLLRVYTEHCSLMVVVTALRLGQRASTSGLAAT